MAESSAQHFAILKLCSDILFVGAEVLIYCDVLYTIPLADKCNSYFTRFILLFGKNCIPTYLR